MSKKILRQSEANVTENRDKPTQTHYCGFVFVLTRYTFGSLLFARYFDFAKCSL